MTGLGRRQLLKNIGLVGGGYVSMGVLSGGAVSSNRSPLLEQIEQYDTIGTHQTGSRGDKATAHWLEQLVHELGLPIERSGYEFDQIDSYTSKIEFAGEQLLGMPLFDSKPAAKPLFSGALGLPGEECDIAVLKAPPHYGLPGGAELLRLRKEGRYQGLAVITDATDIGIRPGLTPLNADAYLDPFGPPVIQLPVSTGQYLLRAALKNTAAEFEFRVKTVTATSDNLIVELPGLQPSLAPLIVMTPTTGWWHCASERGGGVALWLDLLERAGRSKLPRTVIFVATTGHEIGHYGLRELLRSRRFDNAHAWLHLGASFCGKHAFLQLQASDPLLAERAATEMHQRDIRPDRITSQPESTTGEVAEIVHSGAKYISLSGFNPWFHHQDDRWPESIDPERTAVMATIFRSWFNLLASDS